MEQKLTQIGELLRLLEEREQTVDYLTSQVFDKLRPTVLTALAELFDTQETTIDWLDVQVVENVLLVICAIDYSNNKSAYLRKLFAQPNQVDSLNPELKMIRIGIPIAYVFGPKERMIDFLYSVIDDAVVERVESSINPVNTSTPAWSFDTSTLTDAQKEQLDLFNMPEKGVKH